MRNIFRIKAKLHRFINSLFYILSFAAGIIVGMGIGK